MTAPAGRAANAEVLRWDRSLQHVGKVGFALICRLRKAEIYRRLEQGLSASSSVKAGVIPKNHKGRFGWHNLRHSLATFFAENEVNLPLIQAALHHAKPTTKAKYTHRNNAVQIKVQSKFLETLKVARPAVVL